MKAKRKALLRVTGPKFVAGALFIKDIDGHWRLDRHAPILWWMKGLGAAAIREELIKRNLHWEWVDLT